jgi:hypothetical protein
MANNGKRKNNKKNNDKDSMTTEQVAELAAFTCATPALEP